MGWNITLQGLLHADTGKLRDVAAQWDRLVEDIDDTVEDLVRGTRELPDLWIGEGSQAAQERNKQLQLQIGNAHRYCGKIAEIVRRFAYDLEHYQQMLQSVVAEARGNGMTVDLTSGTITAPLTTAADAGAAQASVDSYVSQIEEIVAKANDLDRKAKEAVEAQQIRDDERPEGELPEVVTDFLTFGMGAAYIANVWHGLHPLNRDQLITEHPELVGAAEGVPSADRDRANRLLLARDKQQALAHAESDAVSRATLNASDRLAGLRAVEKQLADSPGSYLLSYPPAVVGQGDPKWDNFVPPVNKKLTLTE
jgi:uncharacterized protein YukE